MSRLKCFKAIAALLGTLVSIWFLLDSALVFAMFLVAGFVPFVLSSCCVLAVLEYSDSERERPARMASHKGRRGTQSS